MVLKDALFVEELQKKSPWKKEILFFETITSTNDIALEMASQGALEGAIIIADEQTQGRGKRHRPWSSPKGLGLFLSLILRLPITMEVVPSLSQLGPVALCDAIASLLQSSLLQIKAPNDLLFDGKKVAGVLVETRSGSSSYAVLGVGINVHQQEKDFPPEIPYPVTSLAQIARQHPFAATITRQKLAEALIQSLYERYQQLLQEPEKLEAAWKVKVK